MKRGKKEEIWVWEGDSSRRILFFFSLNLQIFLSICFKKFTTFINQLATLDVDIIKSRSIQHYLPIYMKICDWVKNIHIGKQRTILSDLEINEKIQSLKGSEMIIMEIFNTNEEVFLGENYFTYFIYETLESTNDIIRSNIFLSLTPNQTYSRSKMKRNQNCSLTSEKFCGNLLIIKNEYFHLCFIESFTFIQFSSNVHIWEEQYLSLNRM